MVSSNVYRYDEKIEEDNLILLDYELNKRGFTLYNTPYNHNPRIFVNKKGDLFVELNKDTGEVSFHASNEKGLEYLLNLLKEVS